MNKRVINRFLLFLASISLLAGTRQPARSQSTPAETKFTIRETVLGVLPLIVDLSDVTISIDSLHYCYPVRRLGGRVLRQDGVDGPPYQQIAGIAYSRDGRRLAYCATKSATNGGSVAHVVVVDGKEGKPYYRGVAKDHLVFSPDSRHFAYAARLPDGREVVVLDGVESEPIDGFHTLKFSPDSRRFAYAAMRKELWSVVLDGNAGESFVDGIRPDSITFSPDSRRLGYVAARGGKNMAVVDGRIGKTNDGIHGPIFFSPDSQHVVYAALSGKRFHLMYDEKDRGDYEDISSEQLLFSPDGKHLAFTAVRNDKWMVVLDDVAGPEFDGIGKMSLVFSPNSQRLAYAAKRGDKWRVVVAKEGDGPEFDGLHRQWAYFSPDSQHLGYFAAREGQWRLVLDGREGKSFEPRQSLSPVSGFAFSPDSRHVAYFARRNGKEHLILDESKVGEYADLGYLVFVDPKTFRVIVPRQTPMFDTELVRLEVTVEGKPEDHHE